MKPHIVHYEGGDLVCGTVDGKPVAMSTAKLPALNDLAGEDLVCSDGTTLLGADDKAGVAEIMSLVARIAQDPSLPHPALGICFCPDEEIGHGAELLDIDAFGCKYAYTVDGGPIGELEWECFNAAEATVRFEGQSIHPGDAKGRMVNAGNLFCDFNALLPYVQRRSIRKATRAFITLRVYLRPSITPQRAISSATMTPPSSSRNSTLLMPPPRCSTSVWVRSA